jgi:hypothetical protein
MSSRIIFDHPELLEDGDELNDLTQATKLFPTKPSRATVERFVRTGVRGVKLATVTVGGRRFTTASAIRRFLIAQQHTQPEHARCETKRGNLSEKELRDAVLYRTAIKILCSTLFCKVQMSMSKQKMGTHR